MREIKFQGWDGGPLRDLSPDELSFCLKAGLSVRQYTGLKDKNGKEIYEGDIISYKYYKGFSNIEKEIIAKVEFVNGCFGFYEYQNEHDSYFNCFDLTDTTVIGNVYENPELLVK